MLRERASGMTKDPASLLGPEEAESVFRVLRISLLEVGTRSWCRSTSLCSSLGWRRAELMPALAVRLSTMNLCVICESTMFFCPCLLEIEGRSGCKQAGAASGRSVKAVPVEIREIRKANHVTDSKLSRSCMQYQSNERSVEVW